MLMDYVQRAMHRATYELLEDNEGFYGEIPGLVGVWANAPTLEGCRDELQSALEDWILFSVAHHDALPVLDGLTLTVKPVEAYHLLIPYQRVVSSCLCSKLNATNYPKSSRRLAHALHS